jgi:hypothetical protein
VGFIVENNGKFLFYLTPFEEQAVRWAERFKEERGTGVVGAYGFTLNL